MDLELNFWGQWRVNAGETHFAGWATSAFFTPTVACPPESRWRPRWSSQPCTTWRSSWRTRIYKSSKNWIMASTFPWSGSSKTWKVSSHSRQSVGKVGQLCVADHLSSNSRPFYSLRSMHYAATFPAVRCRCRCLNLLCASLSRRRGCSPWRADSSGNIRTHWPWAGVWFTDDT